jgi:quinol monooxygenase YgiN
MHGLIVKITTISGKREEMIGILKESAAGVPGCFSYVVAKDSTSDDVLWVTEVWDSAANHDASLLLPSVKNVISRAKGMVSNFEKIAVTSPVWGVGLPAAGAH